jgi:hypothetical protein
MLENLNPLDAFPRLLPAGLVVFLDAGLDAATAADAFADIQRIAHEDAGRRLGGGHGHILAVLRRIASRQARRGLGLFLRRHEPVVALEVLGP